MLPKSDEGMHLAKQLIRSSTLVALNYAEARNGESRRDFIHKMKVVVKELREVHELNRQSSRQSSIHTSKNNPSSLNSIL